MKYTVHTQNGEIHVTGDELYSKPKQLIKSKIIRDIYTAGSRYTWYNHGYFRAINGISRTYLKIKK